MQSSAFAEQRLQGFPSALAGQQWLLDDRQASHVLSKLAGTALVALRVGCRWSDVEGRDGVSGVSTSMLEDMLSLSPVCHRSGNAEKGGEAKVTWGFLMRRTAVTGVGEAYDATR